MISPAKILFSVLIQTWILRALCLNSTTIKMDAEELAVSNQTDSNEKTAINVTSAEITNMINLNATAEDELNLYNEADNVSMTIERFSTLLGTDETTETYLTDTEMEIREIFSSKTNESRDAWRHQKDTFIENLNSTLFNFTWEYETNETIKSNYSAIAETLDSIADYPIIGVVDSAAIVAGVCLITAVFGYFSCVGYRRYLQKKYGNSHMIGHEDVYDTTDLKYFEI